MTERKIPEVKGKLRHSIDVPQAAYKASGIIVNGRRVKTLVFTTDVAILRNINADAAIAVYPFTPQPAITHALMTAAEMPVFCGVGGGTTRGPRVVELAVDAEFQGAMGVVVNAPTPNETIIAMCERIDIPVVITIVREDDETVRGRLDAGASILNVSGAARTPYIVEKIRKSFPDVPIIATGGPTDESIEQTIAAGANAVTYTPPTTGELFKLMMQKYRAGD